MLINGFAAVPFNSLSCLIPGANLGGDCLDLSLHAIKLLRAANKKAHLLPVYSEQETKGKPEHFMVGIPFYHQVADNPLLSNAGLVLVEFGLHIPIPIICRWAVEEPANSYERVPLELTHNASFFDPTKLYTITLDVKNPEWLHFTTVAKPADMKKYIHLKPFEATKDDVATEEDLLLGITHKIYPYFAIYKGNIQLTT